MTLTLKKFYLNQRKKTIANSWTFNKHNRQNILLKKKKTPSILRSLQYYHNRFVLKDYPCLILKINGLKNIK